MFEFMMHWFLFATNGDYRQVSEQNRPKAPQLVFEYANLPISLRDLAKTYKSQEASINNPIRFKYKNQTQIFYDNKTFLDYLVAEFKLVDLGPKEDVIWPLCEASVYGLNGSEGNGPLTASGTSFNPFDPVSGMSAAVKATDWNALKGKLLKVTNIKTNKSVTVTVVDNGGLPDTYGKPIRCIDLQGYAANLIGIPGSYPGSYEGSTIEVRVGITGPDPTTEEKLANAISIINSKKMIAE
jgi:rare lipoprotein A (peptidoglycan hydrolase)